MVDGCNVMYGVTYSSKCLSSISQCVTALR